MNAQTICRDMDILREAFDIVRLVDVKKTVVLSFSENGEFTESPYECFAVWNKHSRCENCISAKAYAARAEMTKFEFLDEQVCFVMARYVVVENIACILEMVKFMDDNMLFGAYGKSDFIDKITSYNAKIYTDSLTGAYNRRYFDEQLSGLQPISAVASLDIDCFKTVNDTFGHAGGDAALKTLAAVLKGNVRSADAVIRLGGDEFLIVFQGMHEENLFGKLDALRAAVEDARIPEYPALRITVSIGGFYCEGAEGDFVKISDGRLYEAKKTKNTVVV